MRILLVDDHAVVRSGLRRLVTLAGRAEVAEAANAAEAKAALRDGPFNVIVLDLNLPGQGGVELLSEIVKADVAPVLVLSMHAEPYYVDSALRAGAAGYVSKNASPEEILTALRRVLKGETYVEGELAQAVVLERGPGSARKPLSQRELEILRHLANGSNLSGVARAVGVSYKTVANACTALKAKLGAPHMSDLIRLAIEIHQGGKSRAPD